MATSANQLAKSGKFGDLRRRIVFLVLALVVYRIGGHIPVPGIDPTQLQQLFKGQSGGILNLFNMFSGGALSRFTVFALGIMPYISASIIMQLMSYVVPSLEAIKKEGESGQKLLNQYTRYLTVVLAAFQANRARMAQRLAQVQALQAQVVLESESKRDKFDKRGQLLPRERVARLIDRGSEFLELSPLAGLGMHDDDGKKAVLGGGSIVGIGTVAGKRVLISASDSGVAYRFSAARRARGNSPARPSSARKRTSDGTTFKDPRFEENWAGIKAAGMVRGVYQFFRPGQSATAQADLMISMLDKVGGLKDGDLAPTLDVEVTDGVAGATLISRMKTWLSKVEAATGRTPMVYTAPGWWSQFGAPGGLGKYTLWVANWGVSCPSVANSWDHWTFWQNSSSGSVPGISGNVDTDRFDGSLADLLKFAGGKPAGGGGGGDNNSSGMASLGGNTKSEPAIGKKIEVLNDLGLGYLTLGQSATTLSGGEAQRIKIATELSKLQRAKHTVYILDEPTTGLHLADIEKLLESLNRLVDAGHSVLLIEHHLDVIKTADHVIDLGPEGGHAGGEVVVTGTPEEVAACKRSHTGRFLKEHLRA